MQVRKSHARMFLWLVTEKKEKKSIFCINQFFQTNKHTSSHIRPPLLEETETTFTLVAGAPTDTDAAA